MQEALSIVKNLAYRRQVEATARRLLPDTGSRCAVTLTQWLKRFGLLPTDGKDYLWTADLLRALPEGYIIIRDVKEVRPLDIVVTLDLNHNHAPDHVGLAMSRPGFAPRYDVLFLDNQSKFEPHERNLGKGPKTPMDYAIRYVWPDEEEPEIIRALRIVDEYLIESNAPQETRRALHELRRMAGMPPIHN